MRICSAERGLIRKLSLDARYELDGVWRSQIRRNDTNRLGLRKCRKLINRRYVRNVIQRKHHGIEYRRIRHEKLLLMDAVKSDGLERQPFGKALVEYTETTPKHRLRRILSSRSGGERSEERRVGKECRSRRSRYQ